MGTKIEWTNETYNPIIGCSKISEGCQNCYAEKFAYRLSCMAEYHTCNTKKENPLAIEYYPDVINTLTGNWKGETTLIQSVLEKPFHWKKPRMIFVCSMGDLFHESVPFEWIDKVFAIMAMNPQHIFQILTKRPERTLKYFNDNKLPFRIAKQIDVIDIDINSKLIKEEIKELSDYPSYYISNFGIIYSSNGSSICVNCGKNISDFAKSKFCSKKCRNKADYLYKKNGKYPITPELCPMIPDKGKQNHCRVMLYKNGKNYRELIHRLVLREFKGLPSFENAQTCHKDGNPLNNHISNLRWGTQSDNWNDRIRHGNGQTHKTKNSKIEPPIKLPFENLMIGITAENQKTADERIPILLQIPAKVRFVSCEPLLENIEIIKYLIPCADGTPEEMDRYHDWIDWVIAGKETGHGARPMKIEWLQSLYQQCKDSKVLFFDKRNELGLNIQQYPI